MKKGIFDDSKDWKIVVGGDWRDEKGNPISYNEQQSKKEIFISEGVGLYFYFLGKFTEAISRWLDDLSVIEKIEKSENERFHKGLFYFDLSLAFKQLNQIEDADKYLKLAQKEDKLTYGKKAKTFPSFKKKL